MRRPSGENAALRTAPRMAGKHGELLAVSASQMRAVLSLGGGNDAPTIGRERSPQDQVAMRKRRRSAWPWLRPRSARSCRRRR